MISPLPILHLTLLPLHDQMKQPSLPWPVREGGEDTTSSAWCYPGLRWTACPACTICTTQGHWEHYPWLPPPHLIPRPLLSLLRLQFTTLSWNGDFPPCTVEESCNWSHPLERKREKVGRVDIKMSPDLAVRSTTGWKHTLSGSTYTKWTGLAQCAPKVWHKHSLWLPSSKWVKVSSLKLPGSVNCLIPFIAPMGLTPT